MFFTFKYFKEEFRNVAWPYNIFDVEIALKRRFRSSRGFDENHFSLQPVDAITTFIFLLKSTLFHENLKCFMKQLEDKAKTYTLSFLKHGFKACGIRLLAVKLVSI